MWPILVCSIAAAAIAIERLFVLARAEDELPQLLPPVTEAIRNRQLARVRELSQSGQGPFARMVRAALRRNGRPRQEILDRIEEEGGLELPSLERHLPILGTIAQLAPLLGLLGTVTGLVRCFQVIQEKATTVQPVNPGDLAGGIWEALLTTVFGLLLAIPAYAVYHYLTYRLHHFANNLQAAALELADLLSGDEAHGG